MSIAQCSICSHYDKNIAVICEMRCLICARCQGNQVIQQLLVDKVKPTEAICPLCEKTMSRTMAKWCRKLEDNLQAHAGVDITDGARVVGNLDCVPSTYSTFLRKFTLLYGDLGGVKDIRSGEEELVDTKEQKLYVSDIVYKPPIVSRDVAQEFACDCFCAQWQIVLKAGDESMASILKKLCSKKKMTHRANDFRAKGIMDYFGTPHETLGKAPILVLLGRITGLLPRNKTIGYTSKVIRKAWGPVATCVMVIAYCETVWKNNVLKSEDGEPDVEEVRHKLNKCSNNKQFSIRRSLRLLQILFQSDQPHWIMAPYLSACKEYSSQCPWSSESKARLYHLIFWTSQQVMKKDGFLSADLSSLIEEKAKELWKAQVKHRGEGEHLTFGETAPMEGAEDIRTFDMVTEEQFLFSAGHYYLTAGHLGIVCVEGWEQECLLMNEYLTRAVISNGRRMAIRGVYEAKTSTLSIGEKNALLRILKWYANAAKREVDWEEVREINLQRDFPFHIPESLMEKTTAELNHHAENVAIEYDMKHAEEFAHDVELFATRKLGPAYTNEPLMRMTRDEMNWEDDRDDLSANKRRISAGGRAVEEQKGGHRHHKLHAGQRELHELVEDLPALSTIAYKSPHPMRNTVSMTDLIDNDPQVLQKLRLLNKVPIGPHSDDKHLKLLRDDVSGIFSVTSLIDAGIEDSVSVDDSATISSSIFGDENSVGAGDEQLNLSGIEEVEISVGSVESLTPSQTPHLQTQTSTQSIPSFSTRGQDSKAKDGPKEVQSRSITPDQKYAVKREDQNYRRTNNAARSYSRQTSNGNTARKRAMKKIEDEKNRRAEETNEKNLAKSLARIAEYELGERQEARRRDKEEKSSFDLHSVMPGPDEPTTPAMSAQSALAAEQAHRRLNMTDGAVTLPVFRMVANNHFKPWQLKVLEDLDISDSRLGVEATRLLAQKLEVECRLVTLKAAGNQMGESGCSALLQSMREGGATETLTHLDLSNNWLTIVADGLVNVGSFSTLTQLDLRNNHIAIDTTRHVSLFLEALSPLVKLKYLNLGQNRIQDLGFSALCISVLPDMQELEVLDASESFLTPASFEHMFHLVKTRNPSIKTMYFQGNIVKVEHMPELKHFAALRNLTLIL